MKKGTNKLKNDTGITKAKSLQTLKNKGITTNHHPLVLSGIKAPKNIKEAKRILSRLISAFIKDEIKDQKAKTLCYLLNSFVMVIRDVDFEERLKSLETTIMDGK